MSQCKPIRKYNQIVTAALLTFVSANAHAAAYYNVGAWFKTQYNKLQFTTSAQSIYAENCSGAVTVQTKNPFGAVKNVSSDLTVSLSAPAGVTFYSDSACTLSITSVTIPSGNNAASFYFIDTATGSATITASASTYTSAIQTETLSTNPYIWTGAGADAQWSTAANWSGGAAPGSSKVAVFKGSACSSNCSPTISTNISIYGVRMNSDYSGTITQSAGNTVTVGDGGWVQLAGNFSGSSSGDAISVGNSNLVINGGSFTSTSGTLIFGTYGGYNPLTLTVGSGATFTHNGGTLTIQGTCATHSISPGNATFNQVNIGATCATYTFNNGTLNVAGNLSVLNPSYNSAINSGTISVQGNVTVTGPTYYSGSAVIKVVGNASGSTVSTPSNGIIPHLTIAAGTNPVTLSGTVNVSGNYVVNSVGTMTTTGSTLVLGGGWATFTVTPGNVTYNNVSFTGSYGNVHDLGGATMTIAGNLSLIYGDAAAYNVINSGTLAVGGNVTATGPGGFGGSAVITLTGNASGQTVSTASGGSIPNLTIAAGSNPVTLSGTVMVRGHYIASSAGSLITTGSTLSLNGLCGGPYTITPGNFTYNNVSISGACASYTLGGNTMTIAGDLTYAAGSYGNALNSGTLVVSGNFAASSASNFTGSIAVQFVGTGTQTVTMGTTSMPSGGVTINKPSGAVVLASDYSQGNTWTLTSGTLYMSGYNFSVNGLSLNSNTIHRKDSGATTAAGVLTVNGTTYVNGPYLGGTVAD
ncbi:MAG: beta strand repeat-containing protein [Bdellovibrionia bacterium]